jgi:hypothetical protein
MKVYSSSPGKSVYIWKKFQTDDFPPANHRDVDYCHVGCLFKGLGEIQNSNTNPGILNNATCKKNKNLKVIKKNLNQVLTRIVVISTLKIQCRIEEHW